MHLFATRFWGFDPIRYPTIQFNFVANRDRLLRESPPSDRIIFAATTQPPTDEEDRGRLLGMAELRRITVNMLMILATSSRSGRFLMAGD